MAIYMEACIRCRSIRSKVEVFFVYMLVFKL
ncbi:uncharacterized protein G2W53_002448 [Senna tora]|uniref:Uncharacterized protein n=1 Tax=Senna tora TaxID=362788 RepID=A0A834XHI6_9FABA|nr:uncharacterized protein G2W53_002448 [Senna tora]